MNKLMPIGASFAKTALPAFLLAAGFAFGGQPAHADPGTGAADWEDGTSDFIADARDCIADPVGCEFDVTFSPALLGSTLANTFSQGELNTYFGTPPQDIFPVVPATATFEKTAPGPIPAVSALFKAKDGLVFDIDTSSNLAGSSVEFAFDSIGVNNTWAGIIEPDGAVAFNQLSGEWDVTFNGGPLDGTTHKSTSSEYEFGQPDGSPFGNYSGALTYEDVPGPLPVLGAGVAFGYSRRLRRRIKSSVSA